MTLRRVAPPPAAGGIQERIDAYWSTRAPDYHASQQRADRQEGDREAWTGIIGRALPSPPARILDVGTGSGYLAFVMAGLGHEVTGLDSSPGMIEAATAARDARPQGPRFVLGDAVDPPGEAGAYDAVTSRYLMWTLREPHRALGRWRRLLRPGGRLVVVDAMWFPDGIHDSGYEMTAYYDEQVQAALPFAGARSIAAIGDAVAAAGFADVAVRPLWEIHRLDVRHGVSPGHDVRLQYLVTAHAP